jgi:hypothetical protein
VKRAPGVVDINSQRRQREALRLPVQVPEQPQIVGVYGAALLAGYEYRRLTPVPDVETTITAPGAAHSCGGLAQNQGPVALVRGRLQMVKL